MPNFCYPTGPAHVARPFRASPRENDELWIMDPCGRNLLIWHAIVSVSIAGLYVVNIESDNYHKESTPPKWEYIRYWLSIHI